MLVLWSFGGIISFLMWLVSQNVFQEIKPTHGAIAIGTIIISSVICTRTGILVDLLKRSNGATQSL